MILSISLMAAVGAQAEEISSKNWTETTAFKPDLSNIEIRKGMKVDRKNVDEWAHLIPDGLKMWIEKYGLVLKLRNYERIHPSQGYIQATNLYRGQPRIIDTGFEYRKRGLADYTAGLPFPQPQTGLEVAWNLHYAYIGDDQDTYILVYWISAKQGVEHIEDWRWAFIGRTVNRTDLEPIPAIPEYSEKGIFYVSLTYALAPYDKRGFGAVYARMVEPLDMQGHIYVPSMRRVLRNTFGSRGDTWNATDHLYEDVKGYTGYPEWIRWKLLGRKTLLMPVHAGVKHGKKHIRKAVDLDNPPHWNPKYFWEPRPVYVVEGISRIPDYPYSRQIFYIEAETNQITMKETYDRKGVFWKIVLQGFNASKDMDSLPPEWAGYMTVDFQSEHATYGGAEKILTNQNLKPQMFTLSNLRKRAR